MGPRKKSEDDKWRLLGFLPGRQRRQRLMNYLAHLYLSPANDLVRLGNLAGDFLRGAVENDLPPAMQQGIALHRAIDRFTDAHPVFLISRRRITAANRRFSGVLVDIFYDHYLARDWPSYAPLPLAGFAQEINQALKRHFEVLPPELRGAVPYLQHWLDAYRSRDGIARVLTRMEARINYRFPLGAAITELDANYDTLAEDFAQFLPEITAYVRSLPEFGASPPPAALP